MIALILAAIAVAAVIALLLIKKSLSRREPSEVDIGTGLGNRAYLLRMYKTIPPNDRHEYAVVRFNLDTEREERAFGRAEMLNHVRFAVTAIKEFATPDDIFARLIGPGLIVLARVPDQSIKNGIGTILDTIRRYIGENDVFFCATISAGVYRLKDTDEEIDDPVFLAWQCSERAVENGENCVFCTDDIRNELLEERALRSEINRAFQNHEFVTYIQFCVDTDSARIVGGEALARWQHPTRGLLTPIHFVPFMERENIISRMDYYTLNEVCKFLDKMTKKGITDFFISCNFSRKTFSSEDFIPNCMKIFSEYSFPFSMLVFEMTESAIASNAEITNKNANAIKELGIKLMLDDFGEGFASFYDLHEYPLDGLKIDKSMVDNIHTRKGNTIIRGMTRLGHELNLKVVAEGVEDDTQVEQLRNIDCDIIQGFRFHRPISVIDAEAELMLNAENA